MVKKRRKYTEEFRDQVMARMRAGAKVRRLGWELNIPRSVLYEWREQAKDEPGGERWERDELRKDREIARLQTQVRDLEAALGRQSLEMDFFQSALRRVGAKIPASRNAGRKTSGPKSAAGWIRKAR